MNNTLIHARDQFSNQHTEARRRINGREWGLTKVGKSGPKLLLLPGTLGRGDIFWQQMQALEGRAQVLALFYPASGSLPEWAADVADIIAAEAMQGAVVLGSSMGGYLAQYLAASRPALFSGLIAANTLPSVAGIDQTMPYALDLDTVPAAELRHIFCTGLHAWTTPNHPNAALGTLLLHEVKNRIPDGELTARLNVLKTAPALPAPALPKSRTFIIECGDDHLINAPLRAAQRAALPAAQCFHFATGSHFPYVTRSADYTAILKQVLQLAPAQTEAAQ